LILIPVSSWIKAPGSWNLLKNKKRRRRKRWRRWWGGGQKKLLIERQ